MAEQERQGQTVNFDPNGNAVLQESGGQTAIFQRMGRVGVLEEDPLLGGSPVRNTNIMQWNIEAVGTNQPIGQEPPPEDRMDQCMWYKILPDGRRVKLSPAERQRAIDEMSG